ncbi:sensor histidine kinase [Enorma phocaeensis]|uniref:Sensor-like histidine kinase SenX3 n=1 Tax=Enorma phocaeensis TaxID=1871019 RepID=A0A921LU06_9ACTN|nr:GHKL domain-containing protein [Enorma phocaeensis]
MKIDDVAGRRAQHAPVNPYTGLPHVPGEPPVPQQGAAQAGHASYGGHAGVTGANGPASAPCSPQGSTPPASTTAPDPAACGASVASSAAGGAPDFTASPSMASSSGPASVPTYPAAPFATPIAQQGNDALVERLRSLADSRVASTIVLVLLLLVIVGLDNLIVFLALLFAGFLLVDRFVNVRRCVVLGGVSWLAVVLLGEFINQSVAHRVFVELDYLFMFCGFLFGVAVCASFFAGRAMYELGYERGQERADDAIAEHIVGRLIDHPDDWTQLDGDFLEVESAINRVRERQRLARQALRDEARRKDDLVTYLAHDLKTPLASVVGYLSLLDEALDLPTEQRARFLGIALDKAHRLDALIEEFFDITRFDFHDIVLTRGYVDLKFMLEQVADEFYPALEEQQKRADIEIPDGLIALIDGDKMARVFNNVMKNAIAYSYEGSTITVSAERNEQTIVIRFENHGDPIPAPKLQVIFEKFYRLDAARATDRGGAGLGLAIAKEIVAAHGGTIDCTSSPERTVFTIAIPA